MSCSGFPEKRKRGLIKPQCLYYALVFLLVRLLEIGKQLLALGYHLEESATGMEILLILLQMKGQLADLLGKERDLIGRGASILLVPLDWGSHLVFLLFGQCHSICQLDVRLNLNQAKPASARSKN